MIKEIIIGGALLVFTAALGASGYWMKRGFEETYLQVDELEILADSIYVRQDVYQQTENQKRIWILEDRIQKIRNNAAGRPLTPDEVNRITQLQRDIQVLR